MNPEQPRSPHHHGSRRVPETTIAPLRPGVLLGPYKIEAHIGAGGMGEVFSAVDTRLGRSVAIKTSKEPFDERFEREARAISALNHPHICTLYDVGPSYLVMELVEGETLASRLNKGRLSLPDALRYGAQIADALSAAHAKKIVHRDLKPQNLMLSKTGVKVLDFGLAKSDQDLTLTSSQAMMGTPAYLAPELFEGKDADARTDIWALGLVLHEMATGKRVMPGQIPIVDVLPPQLAHVIQRCLSQDPDDRWQSARDIQKELEWIGKQPVPAVDGNRRPRVWVLTASAIVVLGLGAWMLFQSVTGTSPRPSPAQFTLSFTEQTSGALENSFPIPSPDGRYVVFGGNIAQGGSSLWLRAIDSGQAHPIPGTEGAIAGFWSPDSRWIGFYADQKLKKVSVAGGVPVTIASLPGLQDATWGKNGEIIYRPTNRAALWLVKDSGGPDTQLTELDSSQTENSHRAPRFLPDGRRFLFVSRCGQRENNALYIGSLDSPKRVRKLMPAQANVGYVKAANEEDGLLLFYRDGGIWAQYFNEDQERLTGQPFVVAESVAYNAASIQAYFSASADGSLIVFRPATTWGTRLSWFSRTGDASEVYVSRTQLFQPRLSPQGDRILYAGVDPQSGNRDLFSIEIARGVVSRLTTHVSNDWYSTWAPDGKRLLFGSDRGGGVQMETFLKESVDAGSGESLFLEGFFSPADWSRDGKWIAFEQNGTDIWISPFARDRKPFQYLVSRFTEGAPRFSPDGRWIAYASDESGRFEVYARPFNGEPASAVGKIQLSNGGGDYPVWRSDGRELYYMDREANVYAVNTADMAKPGAAPIPLKLFRACPGSTPQSPPMSGQFFGHAFDTRDGQRFLVNCSVESPGKFNVLLNWPLVPKG